MKKHESMFAIAAETATNSPFHFAHGAVLVRSGVVLATASNHLGGNRLSPSCPSTHAEIATLARFFGGSVKQCFEKPSKDFHFMEKQQQQKSTSTPLNPSSEFHDSEGSANNNDLTDCHTLLSSRGQSLALNVSNEKTHLVNRTGRVFYGTKKTRDTRKAKKRCVEGCDMYIVRVKKDTDEWAMSRPCRDCWEVMHTLGIKKVYYTTAEGHLDV